MANKKLTILDVFRSCHSMNVEDVRKLFVTNFDAIIREKDATIHSLERQLSAKQQTSNNSQHNSTDSNANATQNNSALNNLKGLFMVNNDQLTQEVKMLKEKNEYLMAENKRIISESEKKVCELSGVVDTQKMTIKSLEANNLVMSELNATLRLRCNLNRDDQCNFD